ncbi:hypothetical protein NL108_006015 [Boleophthalmus pectinirostris]|nr:hypothetical protein NL108_006015 [Boleophthalmus pectinirostris]
MHLCLCVCVFCFCFVFYIKSFYLAFTIGKVNAILEPYVVISVLPIKQKSQLADGYLVTEAKWCILFIPRKFYLLVFCSSLNFASSLFTIMGPSTWRHDSTTVLSFPLYCSLVWLCFRCKEVLYL